MFRLLQFLEMSKSFYSYLRFFAFQQNRFIQHITDDSLTAGKAFRLQTRMLVESYCYQYILLLDFWIALINFVND